MRELGVLRELIERQARLAMGTNPENRRRTEAQTRSATMEAHISRLPIDVSGLTPLQDMDAGSPTYNAWYGMFDLSVFDGDDIFA